MPARFVRPALGRPLAGATAALLFLAASCAPPQVEGFRLVAMAPPPRDGNAPVRIFPAGQQPGCPFEELGYIEAYGNDYPLWSDSTAEAIRRRVRKMGGDAVVGLAEHERRFGTSVIRDSTPALHQSSLTIADVQTRTLRGTVVRFTDAQCRH